MSDHLQEVSSYKADRRYLEEGMVYDKTVYTRMYFTSESHIHGIINVLRYGTSSTGQCAVTPEGLQALDEISEYDYHGPSTVPCRAVLFTGMRHCSGLFLLSPRMMFQSVPMNPLALLK